MHEVRLIDANALAESDMAKLIDRYLYNQCNLTVGLAAALMPEIEAEPVRHGLWIFGSSKTSCWMICSICCKSQSGQTATFSYCPNCGASMDASMDEKMPEVRLIDANAFSEQYGNYYAEQGPEEGFIGTVGELIAKQPTIEPEQRHGRWIQRRNGTYYCTNCGREERFIFQKNYCPKCGADMKEDLENVKSN